MNKTILIFMLIILIPSISATLWVDDPEDCGVEYQSQTCANPGEVVCGYSGGVTFCYDNSSINPPGSVAYSTTSYSGSFDGGYIFDCHSYDGSEPHCDNSGGMWCDRKAACYNDNRQTNCTANTFSTAVCGDCRSGYQACDGSIEDADGCEIDYGTTSYPGEDNAHYDDDQSCNPECDSGYLDCDSDLGTGGTGCEILDGGSCTVAGLLGSYNGCDGCQVDPVEYGYSGTKYNWSGSLPFLWFQQYNTVGWIFNATNYYNKTIGFTSNSCLYLNGTEYCDIPSSSGGGFTYSTYFDQVLNTTSQVSFSQVNSSDWGNVTITESQISDLSHTIDTNCSGNNSCVNLTYKGNNIDVLINNVGYVTTSDDSVSSAEFDNICSTNDRVVRRSGGSWACFDDSVYYDDTTIPDNFWPLGGTLQNKSGSLYETSYFNQTFVNVGGDNMTGSLNITYHNLTGVDCVLFKTGGKICAGT